MAALASSSGTSTRRTTSALCERLQRRRRAVEQDHRFGRVALLQQRRRTQCRGAPVPVGAGRRDLRQQRVDAIDRRQRGARIAAIEAHARELLPRRSLLVQIGLGRLFERCDRVLDLGLAGSDVARAREHDAVVRARHCGLEMFGSVLALAAFERFAQWRDRRRKILEQRVQHADRVEIVDLLRMIAVGEGSAIDRETRVRRFERGAVVASLQLHHHQRVQMIRAPPVTLRQHGSVDRDRGTDMPLGIVEAAVAPVRARKIRMRLGDVDVGRTEPALAQCQQLFPGRGRGGDIVCRELHVAVFAQRALERVVLAEASRQAQAFVRIGERTADLVLLAGQQRGIETQRRAVSCVAGRQVRDQLVDQHARRRVVAGEDHGDRELVSGRERFLRAVAEIGQRVIVVPLQHFARGLDAALRAQHGAELGDELRAHARVHARIAARLDDRLLDDVGDARRTRARRARLGLGERRDHEIAHRIRARSRAARDAALPQRKPERGDDAEREKRRDRDAAAMARDELARAIPRDGGCADTGRRSSRRSMSSASAPADT